MFIRLSAIIVFALTLSSGPADSSPNKGKRPGKLVPPPPPVVPLSSQFAMSGYVPVGLMTAEELNKKKKEVEDRLEHLELIYKDTGEDLIEKQKKAKLFESLYTEGVVSRRELKSVGREARRLSGEFKEAKREVDDAREYLEAIDKRLAEITGRKPDVKGKSGAETGKDKKKKE